MLKLTSAGAFAEGSDVIHFNASEMCSPLPPGARYSREIRRPLPWRPRKREMRLFGDCFVRSWKLIISIVSSVSYPFDFLKLEYSIDFRLNHPWSQFAPFPVFRIPDGFSWNVRTIHTRTGFSLTRRPRLSPGESSGYRRRKSECRTVRGTAGKGEFLGNPYVGGWGERGRLKY